METFNMRTCSDCGNILTLVTIASLGYSVCWNCKTRALIGQDFIDDLQHDQEDFNNVEELWQKRSEMIGNYKLIDYTEHLEQVSAEEIKRFLADNRLKVVWQTVYRKESEKK